MEKLEVFELADEKYSIASLLITLDVFTLESLKEKLHINYSDQLPSAAFAVIDDLQVRNCIEIVEGETLIFNVKTNDFDTKPIRVYEVVSDKREAFRDYREELDKQRFQPDAQGKPRGSHYRVLEQLLESVIAHPENLPQQEATLIAYFELAQEDEVAEQTDLRQRAISDAYVRMLYGRFLEMKSLWEDALLQLLTANRLFTRYEFEELQLITEQQACKILKNQYEQVQKSGSEDQIKEFVDSITKVENTIQHNEMQLDVFSSLVKFILKEIQTTRQQRAAASIKLTQKSAARIQSQLDQRLQKKVHYSDEERTRVKQHVHKYIMTNNEGKKNLNYLYERKREQFLLSTLERLDNTQGLNQTIEENFRRIKSYFSHHF